MRQNKKEIQSQRTITIGLTTDFQDYSCENNNGDVFANNISSRTGKGISRLVAENRSWD